MFEIQTPMRIVFERIRIHFYVCVSLLPLLLRRLDDTRGLLYSCKFFPIEIEHLYQFPKQIISSDAAAVACTGKQFVLSRIADGVSWMCGSLIPIFHVFCVCVCARVWRWSEGIDKSETELSWNHDNRNERQ